MAQGPKNPARPVFVQLTKNGFYVFKLLGGKILKIFCELYEILISVSTNKVLLDYSQDLLFRYCLWLLSYNNHRVE